MATQTKSTTKVVPVLPARNVVVFPGNTIPLTIGRPRSVQAIDEAWGDERLILVVAQKTEDDDTPGPDDLYTVGTLCRIEKLRGSKETGFQALVRGESRARLVEWRDTEDEILKAEVEILEDVADVDEKTLKALLANVKTMAHQILNLVPVDTRQIEQMVDAIEDLGFLTHLVAEHLDVSVAEKQELLELDGLKERSLALLVKMQDQLEALKLQTEIRQKLSEKLSKNQREAILREQLKTIQEELGEAPERGEDYHKKIEEANLPEAAKKVALEEVRRLDAIGNSSPESHVIRTYLDLILAMPWNESTQDQIDLDKARATLDADHYGLEKIKERVIQHLAVMKLRGDTKGSILLFVGPPGVGKTSLGKSIAEALGRKFVRVSLGGVRDDAEIRGHRRTYIGAMPGRIVQGIKRVGVNNPVMVLDEIDKLGRGLTGDPAGALLEVLDPEQNANFSDHYLEIPFDLSKVFFVATANTLESIPAPLLDRMEVIRLSGYTSAEKLHIAKRHLIPKALEEHGLAPEDIKIRDDALMRLITAYTRESGVRQLAREIATLCRASTEAVLEAREKKTGQVVITPEDVERVLGPEKYIQELAESTLPPGVVTGLAWTPVGGDILFVEARRMPGKGQLTLTGQLGDVMKESAQIATSLVRSHLAMLGSDLDMEKTDLHVHVPAGSIPKDGPSAGITILTALASLVTGRRVDPKLAMTGEITLRGAVTPVGGIKEKVIAAHRAGVRRIILPKRNEKDLRDVPAEVKDELTFAFVETAADVLREALGIDVPDFAPPHPPLEPGPAARV